MDWEAKEKERFEAERKERSRLLAMTEDEAMKEGAPIWYQRMRYLREIEAAEWLERIRRGMPPQTETPVKQKRFRSGLTYWKN